jgi:hypothetical protein
MWLSFDVSLPHPSLGLVFEGFGGRGTEIMQRKTKKKQQRTDPQLKRKLGWFKVLPEGEDIHIGCPHKEWKPENRR